MMGGTLRAASATARSPDFGRGAVPRTEMMLVEPIEGSLAVLTLARKAGLEGVNEFGCDEAPVGALATGLGASLAL